MRNWRRAYYPLCRTRPGYHLARLIVRLGRQHGRFSKFTLPVEGLSLGYAAYAGLTRLWQRIHWSPGDGMMPAEQLLAIYRLATSWPADGDIVELGAWVGLTTSYLGTACRVRGKGDVYAVDTFAGTKEDNTAYPSLDRFGGSTLAAFDERIATAGLTDDVHRLVGLTTDVAKQYPGRRIRLLLIDADHSYEGVRDDYVHWFDHVATGGLIVFHDYLMPSVARFVDGEVRRDPGIEFSPGIVDPNIVAVTKVQPTSVVSATANVATEPEPTNPVEVDAR